VRRNGNGVGRRDRSSGGTPGQQNCVVSEINSNKVTFVCRRCLLPIHPCCNSDLVSYLKQTRYILRFNQHNISTVMDAVFSYCLTFATEVRSLSKSSFIFKFCSSRKACYVVFTFGLLLAVKLLFSRISHSASHIYLLRQSVQNTASANTRIFRHAAFVSSFASGIK
jgi:hypothetical protein